MKNLKSLFLVLSFCFIFSGIKAQDIPSPEEENFWSNVQFGGGLGLGIANGFFSATIAPQAVYNFNEKFGLGVGLNASFNNQKNRFKSTILGGSLIGLYNPVREIQLSAELEQLNVNRKFNNDFVTNLDENFWNTALFLGAGYRTNNIIFGIRYDVLYDDERSIYAEPWIPFVRFWF